MTPPHYDDVVDYSWCYYGTPRFQPPNGNQNPHESEYERIRKAFESNLYKWHADTDEMLFRDMHCKPAEMLRRLGEVWGETLIEVDAELTT